MPFGYAAIELQGRIYSVFFHCAWQMLLDAVSGFDDICMPDGSSKRHSCRNPIINTMLQMNRLLVR